ncbi:vitamin B12-dependent ribonucleotide reductase [Christensenellaceae bacterium OttesenSCG-928-M15]|nr:vitamin B12-dependent ribonucleotide reductase [Christensenellaceae bacterium OttesenSCG-928-M15]
MELSANAITVLERRYLTKDENGTLLETPEALFTRVANAVAKADEHFSAQAKDIEKTAKTFYELMTACKFLPNSPTLMNAGKPLGQLSACFVLPVGDSMEEIFDAVKNAALIHKSGGGTGFSFSRLRPSGAAVRSTGGVASGPISFMKVFNAATEAVKQGGTRRGANMGILRVDHPDILRFIRCKQDDKEITNFNISVGLTEAFMQAVENDEEYDLFDPRGKTVVERLRAREVFDLIVDMAWQNGEPGIVFLDRLNRDNVVPTEGEIESTNPCGEQPLLPYESCNLGSINLARMIVERDGVMVVDYDELGRVVDTAVHFLDNVIEINKYPLDEIAKTTKATRKIGLGVMGFADMLYRLSIPYNSDAGIQKAEEIMHFIQSRAHKKSAALAKERGAFPLFEKSTLKDGEPQRNGTLTTIAPTGTISILSDASSGVEPLFALSFVRNVMDRDALPQVNAYFEEVAKKEGFYSEKLMRKIAEEGTLAHIDEVPEAIKRVFVTAHDISPEYHVRMQAAFQKYTDNAVSKTVNFTHDATREDVRSVYELAFQLGCKGVTIYRDGSRNEQVLTVGTQTSGEKVKVDEAVNFAITPRPRPDVTRGITEKIVIGCGNLYVTVNYDEKGICEVFTNLGRAGGCPSQSEATSRLVSTALRAGMDVDSVIEQLKGIRCHSTLRQKGINKDIKVLSCPDAIGRVLEKVAKLHREGEQLGLHISNHNGRLKAIAPALDDHADTCKADDDMAAAVLNSPCPDCGGELNHEGGCVICKKCGYSKCG